MIWVGALMTPFFILLNKAGWFRVPENIEIEGLDDSKHGGSAYGIELAAADVRKAAERSEALCLSRLCLYARPAVTDCRSVPLPGARPCPRTAQVAIALPGPARALYTPPSATHLTKTGAPPLLPPRYLGMPWCLFICASAPMSTVGTAAHTGLAGCFIDSTGC